MQASAGSTQSDSRRRMSSGPDGGVLVTGGATSVRMTTASVYTAALASVVAKVGTVSIDACVLACHSDSGENGRVERS